jgi:sialic acid synthase SpsE
MSTIEVEKRLIGGSSPCFIIAEIGINHNVDLNCAKKLIDAAYSAGCDAVKFQAFKAERMYPRSAGEIIWKDENKQYSYDIFKANQSFEVPNIWWSELRLYTKSRNMLFMASICDEISCDKLAKYFDILKVTSFAINHFPLLHHIASVGKPMIFSTGASTFEEVKEAYDAIKSINKDIMILHCVSEYPTPLTHANLSVVTLLKKTFPEAIIGYSDHTEETEIAPNIAVALGAKVIEKHITLDRKMSGPDHFFALEPEMLKSMVKSVRDTEAAILKGRSIMMPKEILGNGNISVTKSQKYIRRFARQGIMSTRNMKAGELITKNDICVLRYGNKKPGLSPKWYDKLSDNKYILCRDVAKEDVIKLKDIKKSG